MVHIQHRLKSALRMAAAAGLLVSLGACSSLHATNTVALTALLTGAAEVPPATTSGTGMAEATLDKETRVLAWKVTFTGLTGAATAAHIHGPAAVGSNAGVVIPFTGTASPLEGQATLTEAQVADLLAGKWYVNVHTAANKGGEIRGQLAPRRFNPMM